MLRAIIAAVALLVLTGCQRGREPAEQPLPDGVDIVTAPADGEVAGLVRVELDRAKRDRRRLLVYVSAAWREPCRYFEQAMDGGALEGPGAVDVIVPRLEALLANAGSRSYPVSR